MIETLHKAEGVGLAAPQVGILRRVVVIDVGEGPIELVTRKSSLTAASRKLLRVVFQSPASGATQ